MIKLKTSAIITSGVLVTSLTSAYLFNGVAYGNWDFDGLNQQVQHVTEVSDNHEARLTNVENKVDAPADKPTPTPEVVTRVVTQPAPQATSAPAKVEVTPAPPVATPVPKTVTKVEHWGCTRNDSSQQYMKLIITHYSDGTAAMTDENGVPYTGVACQRTGTW